uniref:Progesterone 5-beta-reductase-like protein n=1 Tax=Cordyceps militaris TaxID=73501 RepID=J3SID9_CORMI|nr:progesterone 5-beta-reductase-like protein [Cordyceps militaris]
MCFTLVCDTKMYRIIRPLTKFAAFNTSNTDNQLVMKDDNTKMLATAVRAMEKLAPSLSFIALQTGSNVGSLVIALIASKKAYFSQHYGILFAEVLGPAFGPVPLREDLPRLPPPLSDSLMFYSMVDEMSTLSAGKAWKWCDIRPDMIVSSAVLPVFSLRCSSLRNILTQPIRRGTQVGHPPRPNSHSIAESVGAYLALYAHIHPAGSVPFPGTQESWKATFRFTGEELLGDFAVRLSEAKGTLSSGEAFNIAHSDVTSWSQLWPQLAQYWGLRGVGPSDVKVDVQDWVISNVQGVREWEQMHRLQPNRLLKIPWRYFEWAVNMRTSRQMDLARAGTVGYEAESTHLDSFKAAWERLQLAKCLPSQGVM